MYPELDCGRFPVKRVVGDRLEVWADIIKEGTDMIQASLKVRRKGTRTWSETPMRQHDNDRWSARYILEKLGTYEYSIEAWTDEFGTTVRALQKWFDAGEDVSEDMKDLHKIIERAIESASGSERSELSEALGRIRGSGPGEALDMVSQQRFSALVGSNSPRRDSFSTKVLEVVVDRAVASFSAWYEMFHRSQGAVPGRSATLRDAADRLEDVKQMGFDVVYLPPIHPIGRTNRRGRNNSGKAAPDEPGSPWAIGGNEGGHTSINPDLGTMEDFRYFMQRASNLGIEVAIDLALNCSPDHPYVTSHPEWFFHRSDGSIRYAENPPKKYYDIFPLNFGNEDWKGLWMEVLRVVLFWVEAGVKIFRVDNPHTKPLPLWEWLISQTKERNPEVIFLAEAFTRPKLMKRLAKLGFSQSYTYFTWKNRRYELIEFLTEFVTSDAAEYYRGNFFTNTPDILSEYLQTGGRPAFKIRVALAATLSSVFGIYNGYELCENRARGPGSEEYLDSEKYQYKVWDWNRPGNIKPYIAKLNLIRKSNPALHSTKNLRILRSTNESIFFYGKWTEDKSNVILVAVNLDPFRVQEANVFVPIDELSIGADGTYSVLDLITGKGYRWKGEVNYVRLDPGDEPAHVLLLTRQ